MKASFCCLVAKLNIRVVFAWFCSGPLKTKLLMDFLNTDAKKNRRLVRSSLQLLRTSAHFELWERSFLNCAARPKSAIRVSAPVVDACCIACVDVCRLHMHSAHSQPRHATRRCTCRWAASARRARWPAPWCSSPRTTPATSPARSVRFGLSVSSRRLSASIGCQLSIVECVTAVAALGGSVASQSAHRFVVFFAVQDFLVDGGLCAAYVTPE